MATRRETTGLGWVLMRNAKAAVMSPEQSKIRVRNSFIPTGSGLPPAMPWRPPAPRHIVSVRGMLEPWAVRNHAAKKRLAWTAYQRCDLVNAAAIHATSTSEMTAIRKMGLYQPVILVPNGIFDACPLPRLPSSMPRQAFFLSRISRKKGIPMLLEAWNKVRPPNWRLVIAGNDEGGYAEYLRSQIVELGLVDIVQLMPGLPDTE